MAAMERLSEREPRPRGEKRGLRTSLRLFSKNTSADFPYKKGFTQFDLVLWYLYKGPLEIDFAVSLI